MMKWRTMSIGMAVATVFTDRQVGLCEKDGPYWDPEPLERAAKVFREINDRPNAKQVSSIGDLTGLRTA